MKNKIIYITMLAVGVVIFYACRKNDNPKLPDGVSNRQVPQLTQDKSKAVLIQSDNLPDFSTAFNVALYFPTGVQPKATDVVVAMNGKYNNVKVLQGGIGSLPTTVTMTGTQLMQLFGLGANSLKAGDYFEVTTNFTMNDGTQIHGFGDTVTLSDGTKRYLRPYGSDVLNSAGLIRILTYTKVCPLIVKTYLGSMTVDDPGVTESTYPVTVSVNQDSTIFTFTGWAGLAGVPVTATFDKASYRFTMAKQKIADLFQGYHNLTVSGNGQINPCDTTIVLNVTTEVDEGSFGSNVTTLSKP
ncbi:hypothetical protein ACTJJB_06235 [Chitinophaga sp. 22536]|uniref:hypothetical protein n=1 Tax=unclassified Chitinophaga TaxID=2619133 RepID=UPI003F87B2E3